MKLPRPYVPLLVKCDVAWRQCVKGGLYVPTNWLFLPRKELLQNLLRLLFAGEKAQLDHDPALQNRLKVYRSADGTHVEYIPAANDPEHLVWRLKEDHRIKTLVRGDGAQYSDAALARKNKRIARKRDPNRKTYKWPKRKMRRANVSRV